MQCLGINKQKVEYALYLRSEDSVKDGKKTGGKVKVYSDPVTIWANVSPRTGSADFEPFGVGVDYDRVMVTSDLTLPITETTILWIGVPSSGPHNYIVRKVAKSLNSATYALKEVTVS